MDDFYKKDCYRFKNIFDLASYMFVYSYSMPKEFVLGDIGFDPVYKEVVREEYSVNQFFKRFVHDERNYVETEYYDNGHWLDQINLRIYQDGELVFNLVDTHENNYSSERAEELVKIIQRS